MATFHPLTVISDSYDDFYRICFQPLVRIMVTEWVARLIRLFHPLRMSRYMISDGNPFFTPIKSVGPLVKANRQPVDAVIIAEKIAVSDQTISDEEKKVPTEIKKTLRLVEDDDNDSRN